VSRTREEWTAVFAGTDACVTPVLGLTEAPAHPHLAARGTYVETAAGPQPAPAPRFSRTPAAVRGAPRRPGQDTVAALTAWGFTAEEVAALIERGAVVQSGSGDKEEVR
jgi:alpha-methylacyl-CoA racemase